jgi:signal transduction histidine kinase
MVISLHTRFRLRTKLLLMMAAVLAAFAATALLVVSRSIERRERSRIVQDLNNSVLAFRNAEQQREITLGRAANLISDLPIVRALMTTRDPATIQDEAADLSRLAGTDLFAMAGQNGNLLAFRVNGSGLQQSRAQELLSDSLKRGDERGLWVADGHLYGVALHPIYFGSETRNSVLGFLAIGFEIDERVTGELSQISGSDVAFRSGNSVLRSTLTVAQQKSLESTPLPTSPEVADLQLDGERFLAATVRLSSTEQQPVELTVLKSLDKATAFLHSLNRLLLALGIIAVLAGTALVFLISHTITRPLQELVKGVRALGRGDYEYPLKLRSGDEVGELTSTFDQMRARIQRSQRELLEAERLATIGRMANSISHDLRHHLAAIYANAEFLADRHREGDDREELYQEVRAGVLDMTELIESLLEFSRTRESLRLEHGDLQDVIEHAVQAVRLHREYQVIRIDVHIEGETEGRFDAKKLERVFHNLLLNACAAVPRQGGTVSVTLRDVNDRFEIRVSDNGKGIPAGAREHIFEPFFSYGKENGTGLGLNVAQKIIEDHGGQLRLESTGDQGTVFFLVLPHRRVHLQVDSGSKLPADAKAAG